MKHKIEVLIIDDHPIICEAYTLALQAIAKENKYEFNIDLAHNADIALAKIEASANDNTQYQLIILDIKLPPSKDKRILSGEDLGKVIKEKLPNSKIIIATTYNDNYRIYHLLKELNPEGLLIKNDITSNELILAFKKVLVQPPYYSNSVLQMIRNEKMHKIALDKIDRRLLYELSLGTKTKNLPEILPLSIAGVEKRKRNLKLVFNVKGKDDKDLILKAKEKGFL